MDHKNMSLEDIIKKDRHGKKFGGNPKFQGNKGNFQPRGGNQGGNVVPRFRQQGGGIFKKRQGGPKFGGSPSGTIELPPRSGQRQAEGQVESVQARRIKRFRDPIGGGDQQPLQRRNKLFGPNGRRLKRRVPGGRAPIVQEQVENRRRRRRFSDNTVPIRQRSQLRQTIQQQPKQV